MSLADQNRLADALRRGRLTPAEETDLQDFLARHPEQRIAWDEELALNHLLRQLPEMPVPSNFTALVLQAARREGAKPAAAHSGLWRRLVLSHLRAKLAVGSAAICLGLFSYHQHELAARREFAQNLAEMSRLATGSSLELLQNFDAIERLNGVPPDVDRKLIAALQ